MSVLELFFVTTDRFAHVRYIVKFAAFSPDESSVRPSTTVQGLQANGMSCRLAELSSMMAATYQLLMVDDIKRQLIYFSMTHHRAKFA